MMSRYVLFFYEGVDEVGFLSRNRDDCTQPYIRLNKALAEKGIHLEMVPRRPLEDYEWLCFWNVYSLDPLKLLPKVKRHVKHFLKFRRLRTVYCEAVTKKLQDRMVLLLSEPPTVTPNNYDECLHKPFKYIFTWNRSLVDNRKYFAFNLPTAELPLSSTKIPFSERKMLVDISGNKHSFHERELYSERRKSIQYFEKHFPNDFDLYGFGWDKPKKYDRHHYTSYRGTVESKQEVLSKYRFAICFENIRDEMDYVSNRIFDVLQADCVPIYWGAPNIADSVDPGAIINRAEFSSNEELATYLSTMSEKEHLCYLNAVRNYVQGDKIRSFFADAFITTFVSVLGL